MARANKMEYGKKKEGTNKQHLEQQKNISTESGEI